MRCRRIPPYKWNGTRLFPCAAAPGGNSHYRQLAMLVHLETQTRNALLESNMESLPKLIRRVLVRLTKFTRLSTRSAHGGDASTACARDLSPRFAESPKFHHFVSIKHHLGPANWIAAAGSLLFRPAQPRTYSL